MNKETVYIKADRNVEVTHPKVTLGDVLQMECKNKTLLPRLKTKKLLTFTHPHERQTVSILEVIACMHQECPEIEINNLGEADFIVTYEVRQETGRALHVVKTVLVVLISFCGAAFSTMAFNNDVGVTKMFGQIYELVTGRASDGFTVLEVTYCIGVTIGILAFFNHFGKVRFSVDPTPIEVEMRLYENDLQTTLIENHARKGQELDVGNSKSNGN